VTRRRSALDRPSPPRPGHRSRGVPRGEHGVQGFAPCGRRLRRPWTPRPPRGQRLVCHQADACWLSL